jgi:hypothetical protein
MRRRMVHPETGEKLARGVRETTIRYGGVSRVVDLPGWYPVQQDGDGVLEGADMTRLNEAGDESGSIAEPCRSARDSPTPQALAAQGRRNPGRRPARLSEIRIGRGVGKQAHGATAPPARPRSEQAKGIGWIRL